MTQILIGVFGLGIEHKTKKRPDIEVKSAKKRSKIYDAHLSHFSLSQLYDSISLTLTLSRVFALLSNLPSNLALMQILFKHQVHHQIH